MEIRQLQSLLKLIECNYSVSKAAEEMFLVQSAVSQHLKKLEDELEADLFIRKGKRLTGLTEIGESVAVQARPPRGDGVEDLAAVRKLQPRARRTAHRE